MSDIVERLRESVQRLGWAGGRDAREAADKLATLRAQLATAREALQNIQRRAAPNPTATFDDRIRDTMWIDDEARRALAALDGKEDQGDG